MLQSVFWALGSMGNSTTKVTPGQLIFSRDLITQARIKVDWDRVTRFRREMPTLTNKNANASHRAHGYQEGEQVLVKLEGSDHGSILNKL